MDSPNVKIKKKEKLVSLLAEIAGSFVRFEVDPNAMVTVTRTELSDDSRTAKFLVSVFPKNKEREISGLRKAMEVFNLKKGLILTFEQEEIIQEKFKISVKPVWKWLLKNES